MYIHNLVVYHHWLSQVIFLAFFFKALPLAAKARHFVVDARKKGKTQVTVNT